MDVRPRPDGLNGLIVSAPEYDAEFEVWGVCPVQALGTVRDRDLFFHARHDSWWFEVADRAGNMPSDGYHDADGFYYDCAYPNAGYMPLREAIVFMEQCLREYTGVPG